MKDTGTGIDEKELKTLLTSVNKYSFSPSVAYIELNNKGMSEHQDLVVAQVIAKKLSGTYKRGAEIQSDKLKGTSYLISIETLLNHQNVLDINSNDVNAVKIIRGNRYFDTSLSFIMAGQQSESSRYHDGVLSRYQESNHLTHDNKSLHFSLS